MTSKPNVAKGLDKFPPKLIGNNRIMAPVMQATQNMILGDMRPLQNRTSTLMVQLAKTESGFCEKENPEKFRPI